jgi:NitT/TauT family transport system ATP-binding protein
MATVSVRNVWKEYGATVVLENLRLEIADHEFVTIIGASGCGKTTFLKMLLGMEHPTRGQILIDGMPIRPEPDPARGVVFQRYSSFPHLTVLENVMLGLELQQSKLIGKLFGAARRRAREAALAMLESVGLAHARDRYPAQLSGGMQQRMSIAQAVICKPKILLLDEPFGALDEATREELQLMLLRIYQENVDAKRTSGKPAYTILIVTHELNEALFVADRVVGLSQYWRWEDEGHASCPGATIVYDAVAPVFHPDAPRDYGVFDEQRMEVRRATFSPEARSPRLAHVRFWQEIQAGKGEGVLAP